MCMDAISEAMRNRKIRSVILDLWTLRPMGVKTEIANVTRICGIRVHTVGTAKLE